ncbi:nucleotide exchange factor GrpE [Occultella kanbiaonis]|uniref:nucleotide exchange factor GrpE n=1 Tax=Occultella kanbiaonis TaxID=2675754 RepID=UPI001E291DF4|nr:nucleotide exchange factor GrpE [Occultella kanbiaonis]
MTPENESEPVIRDKRRLDPNTGEVRSEAGAAVEPDGGAAQADASPAEPVADGDTAPSGDDELAKAKAEALDLADQVARGKADLYNLDQRFNNFVKRSRAEAEVEKTRGTHSVIEALIPVLDDIAAARQHQALEGPFASIADKLESTLTTRFALERFGAEGEEFDPNVHEALMHNQSPDVTVDTITTVLQPGYRAGDVVIRPARVGVTGPE